MHDKYHTEALVLGSFDHKEANKLLHLFTKELGFLIASVQAIRSEKSKLRYGLQDFSLCDVSIVKTKNDIWKLTNCSPKKNYYFDFKHSAIKTDFIAKINNFLRRFLHGQEKDESLYKDTIGIFENLEDYSDSDIVLLEGVIILKILHRLGILKDSAKFLTIIENENNFENIKLFDDIKKEAYLAINQSLEESHL